MLYLTINLNPKYALGFQMGLKPKENQTIGRMHPDTNRVKT
ncbi:hypothetical protein P872_02495 [Rhodonellum psychrophilum GCM71 = DSM 17998]|uniref:Uncharacterized protein n=1 Tax=Rhodonellum psychrophilum GCM71 = DSM 17998 TaxID=1123057 RepID=U5C645_9BACT|nr:hypothetical protein P872_02495 [Rhodonellum psychrophilum GCM71 = DSM 17998]